MAITHSRAADGSFTGEGRNAWDAEHSLGAKTTFPNPQVSTQNLTDAASIDWDMNLGSIAMITLGGNRTLAAPSNLPNGTAVLVVKQDGSGNRTLGFNAAYKFPGGTDPVLSSASGAVDIVSFICDASASAAYGQILKAFA